MAEFDFETDGQDGSAGAFEQTGDGPGGQAEGTQEDGTTAEGETFAPPPADPNDPQYRHWQAAYTRSRQRDRERYGQMEQEHSQYGGVLRNFYQSDDYALQVFRQRFPGAQIALAGQAPSARPAQAANSPGLEGLLAEHLGDDLAFMAPRLAPALEAALQSLLGTRLAPLQQRVEQREQAERERQHREVFARLDSQVPGWEATYAADMEALNEFLAGDDVQHPKFGSRHELLLRLLTPDLARVDAARSMAEAGSRRITTGRAGRPGQPDVEAKIRQARHDHEAFALAAQHAMHQVRRGG